MDQAREEVAKSTAPEHEGMSEHEAELADLRTRLAEVEAGYRVSPDHLRRIREELDRLSPR
jgi:hypothetical protein